jgi:DNA-binding MarR family transcriptional regulator
MKNVNFDDLIHAPNRLMICAILEPVSEMEFALLKEQLAVSDSVLSKHLKTLLDANYLNLKKVTQDGRQVPGCPYLRLEQTPSTHMLER